VQTFDYPREKLVEGAKYIVLSKIEYPMLDFNTETLVVDGDGAGNFKASLGDINLEATFGFKILETLQEKTGKLLWGALKRVLNIDEEKSGTVHITLKDFSLDFKTSLVPLDEENQPGIMKLQVDATDCDLEIAEDGVWIVNNTSKAIDMLWKFFKGLIMKKVPPKIQKAAKIHVPRILTKVFREKGGKYSNLIIPFN